MSFVSYLWNKLVDILILKDEQLETSKNISDEEIIKKAHKELVKARKIFDMADEEMMDYAITNLTAAEKKYDYLLKKLKGGTPLFF